MTISNTATHLRVSAEIKGINGKFRLLQIQWSDQALDPDLRLALWVESQGFLAQLAHLDDVLGVIETALGAGRMRDFISIVEDGGR